MQRARSERAIGAGDRSGEGCAGRRWWVGEVCSLLVVFFSFRGERSGWMVAMQMEESTRGRAGERSARSIYICLSVRVRALFSSPPCLCPCCDTGSRSVAAELASVWLCQVVARHRR